MIRTWAETIAAILCAALAIGAVAVVAKQGDQDRRRALDEVVAQTGGDPNRGLAAMARIGCGACHEVPGLDGAHGRVGPSLARFGARVFVGGVAENTSDNLVRWILDPRSLSPHTAMPALGLDPQTARDIAARLYLNGTGP